MGAATAGAWLWVTNTPGDSQPCSKATAAPQGSREISSQLSKSQGCLSLPKALPRRSREIIQLLLPSSPCPQPEAVIWGVRAAQPPLFGVYSSRDLQACVVQLPAQQRFHVEWSKPVPREINHSSAFLHTAHSAFLPNFSPLRTSVLLWGPSFAFAVAQAKGNVLLGTWGDTSTAGPNSAPCQQPLPQGTSTASQNSLSLHSTGNSVLHPHRGSSQLSYPEWVGIMVFNPSVSGDGWNGEFGWAASYIHSFIKANQGCAGRRGIKSTFSEH